MTRCQYWKGMLPSRTLLLRLKTVLVWNDHILDLLGYFRSPDIEAPAKIPARIISHPSLSIHQFTAQKDLPEVAGKRIPNRSRKIWRPP